MVSEHPTYGRLGTYNLEGESLYGLYIRIGGRDVFVDIRKDNLLKRRAQHAEFLHANSLQLEENLKNFVGQNRDFQGRAIDSIGLHSRDLNQSEVFWDPEGGCLLEGLRFVLA